MATNPKEIVRVVYQPNQQYFLYEDSLSAPTKALKPYIVIRNVPPGEPYIFNYYNNNIQSPEDLRPRQEWYITYK
jgi:hypothetical protein